MSKTNFNKIVGDAVNELNVINSEQLNTMMENNEDPKCTAFTVTCDYKIGTTTGISAYDRAMTIRKIADPSAKANEFTRPGHIFPLKYAPGGVLNRVGHTEASVDLAELCGFYPAGFLCEIVNKDGTMMRRPELEKFGEEHGLKLITIADLAIYKKKMAKQTVTQETKFGQNNITNNTSVFQRSAL